MVSLVLIAIVLLASIAFGLSKMNDHKLEKKLGSDYIVAVQTSNYNNLGAYIYPPIKDVVGRLETANKGTFTKADGYKSILTKSGQVESAAKDRPKSPKILYISEGGDVKYIIISYKIGSNYVSVYEVYDTSGKPHVLTMKAGNDSVGKEEFMTEYDALNQDIKLINALLNQAGNPTPPSAAQQNPAQSVTNPQP